METKTPLREIVVRIGCRGGLCCTGSNHPGRLLGVSLLPLGACDAVAVRAVETIEASGLHRSPGVNVWMLEQLAGVAPLVCGVGGEPVDVGALVKRLMKDEVWQ